MNPVAPVTRYSMTLKLACGSCRVVLVLLFLGVSASRRLAFWGVGQLADRPAVNREVGGSSPPAPVSPSGRGRDPHHHHAMRGNGRAEAAREGAEVGVGP